jgi:hypothetical protein
MIKIIGIRRLVILVVLLAFNAVLASAMYMYLIPEKQLVERKHDAQRNEVNDLQGDLSRMEVEFETLDQQQGRYDQIRANGFFDAQDRAVAKEMFSLIQEQSKVISALVSVKPGKVVGDAEAEKANHKLLMSGISVDIKAFDDNDIYHYIDLVQKVFPGVVTLKSISVKREKDVSAALLRAIASGASPELVTAEVEFSWHTMIPQEQVLGTMSAAR